MTSRRKSRNWRSAYVLRWSDRNGYMCGRYKRAAKHSPCAHIVRADDVLVDALLAERGRPAKRSVLGRLGIPSIDGVPPIAIINGTSSVRRKLDDPRYYEFLSR